MVHALHIDRAYSSIRKDKRMAEIAIQCSPSKARNRDRYYQLQGRLRDIVSTFSTMMLAVLEGADYTAWAYSDSRYLMIDTEIHVDIGGVTFRVWSFKNSQYGIHIENDSYYNYPLLIHPCSNLAVPIYTMQGLLDGLNTIRAIIIGYRQCLTCYYAPNNEYYCGKGLTPMGSCSHYRDKG